MSTVCTVKIDSPNLSHELQCPRRPPATAAASPCDMVPLWLAPWFGMCSLVGFMLPGGGAGKGRGTKRPEGDELTLRLRGDPPPQVALGAGSTSSTASSVRQHIKTRRSHDEDARWGGAQNPRGFDRIFTARRVSSSCDIRY